MFFRASTLIRANLNSGHSLLCPNVTGLNVRFEGEPATGLGVTREWFAVVASQLFDPKSGYFRVCSGGNTLVHIDLTLKIRARV